MTATPDDAPDETPGPELSIQNRIRLAVGARTDVRIFRNCVGKGWMGRVVDSGPRHVTLADPRRLVAGLAVGSSDLVGWGPGGRFLALEVKTARGTTTAQQASFLAAVRAGGGIAAVVRSPEEALDVLG